jgi:tetratricopeptide (TPR) repeat protein
MGQGEAALAYLSSILERDPENLALLTLAARLSLQARHSEAASALARRAHAIREDATTSRLLASALRSTGKTREAEQILEKTASRPVHDSGGERIQLLLDLADLQIELGQYESAKKNATAAAGLAARNPRAAAAAHRKLSKIENKLGNDHQAEWELRRAQELDPR